MTRPLPALFALLLIGCAPTTTTLTEGPLGQADAPTEDTIDEDEADPMSGDTGWDTGWDGTPLPPAACSGNACDGQDPVAMGCTGLSTLANGTNGAVTWALRYSSVCKTIFVRAWRHSTAGHVQARVWRESDLFNYQIDEPAVAVNDKQDSGMVYCPSGSCSAMACARDSSTGSYSCTDWK